MKHQRVDQILSSAILAPSPSAFRRMNRQERLEHWAQLLEAHEEALHPLRRIEYLPPLERRTCRGANTPLSVAFGDHVLRRQGLCGEILGDAMDFFELSDRHAHRLLCECHFFGSTTGKDFAHRIRQHARWSAFRERCSRAATSVLARFV
jgi:hypothetical protein